MNPAQVYDLALQIYGDPIEARIAAAQMQLETGGGRAMPGNNLFGIKGPGQSLATTEVVDGVPVRTSASFRTYADPRESIADRLQFLRENPRYERAGYFAASTPGEKADALQRAGYATDPDYAAKLKRIMGVEGVRTLPVSDFPQFDPSRMGLRPVSAQMSSPAGVLGPGPKPLIGPTRPTGLLDRFVPGSGYGYDVALGIAGTGGPPMTALAGGLAHAHGQAFERDLAGARMGLDYAALTGPTAAQKNYEYLIQQQVDPQTAREAAFGGQGTVIQVGGQSGTQYGSVPSGHTRTITETGQVIDEPNPGTAEFEKREAKKRIETTGIAGLEKMIDMIRTHGEGLDLRGKHVEQAEMGMLYLQAMRTLGDLNQAGVMEPGEMAIMEKALPDPRAKFTLAGKDAIIAAYRALLDRARATVGAGDGGAGQGGSTPSAGASTPGNANLPRYRMNESGALEPQGP